MPYYDYRCGECGKKFEVQQTFQEHDRGEDHEQHKPLKCPKCGGRKVEALVASSVYVITSKKS
jgi:putative FmdB family regulatory protein